MGRTLPVPVSCQVCGDKSYGRHYGVFCCDGCSCFFKRSIRKNITYVCISGDKTCVVDKARRNWCPACRLDRCYAVKMNKHAVQEERGPRKPRSSVSEPGRPIDESAAAGAGAPEFARKATVTGFKQLTIRTVANDHASITNHHLERELADKIDQILHDCLQSCTSGPILKFADENTKKAVLKLSYHHIFLLHLFHTFADKPGQLLHLLDAKVTKDDKLVEVRRFLVALGLDQHELHLCTCLLLCCSNSANAAGGLSQVQCLSELYWMMLAQHCTNFYSNDVLRVTKIAHTLTTIQKIRQEQVDPLVSLSRNYKWLQ